jgi:hypothetical protein
MDSTVRYLGVELEDDFAIAEAIEIEQFGLSSRSDPERPLSRRMACCGAARRTGHSLQSLNLRSGEFTQQTVRT